MVMDVTEHIKHTEKICNDKNLNVIIFHFRFESISYKCFYSLGGEAIIVAPEGCDIAISIYIKDNILDNFFPKEVYLKLKEIHKGQLKTKEFCNNMLDTILNLNEEDVLKNNMDFYKLSANRIQNVNENDRIFFYCWSRSFTGRKPTEQNLRKTRLYFGYEIYLVCKMNNISSRWKDKSTNI